MAQRVLIVEDDRATQILLQKILAHELIDSATADDGAAALWHIRREEFGAILLDLLLPHVNGFEVLRELKSTRSALIPRVIVVTAASESTWAGCEEIRSVYCLLLKPLDVGVLTAHVRGCIDAEPAMVGNYNRRS